MRKVKEQELEFNKEVRLNDVIFSERRGQSQKPEEIYKLIEKLVPNGKYCEIFARKNNLHDYWVSLGKELKNILPYYLKKKKKK